MMPHNTTVNAMQMQLQEMQAYFASSATTSYAARLHTLLQLKNAVLQHQSELQQALHSDLGKSAEEAWVTEIGFLLTELRYACKHLKKWMQPRRVATNLLNFGSKSFIYTEPLGLVLIIAPWNYPFQLLFVPLVGAIAGGNCVVLKPSEAAPATAAVMQKIIAQTFSNAHVLYVPGDGAMVVKQLIDAVRFNHIFYTGSTAVGKKIYQLAAEKLVPVTLELGGKSPCVIAADANLNVAARRIALAKFSNAGQMCVAPDYVLVHRSVKEAWLAEMKRAIQTFFSNDAEQSADYGRIVNQNHFNRLANFIQQHTVLQGGRYNAHTRFIEPTLLDVASADTPVMQEEIFGPLLPVLTYDTDEEARAVIAKNPDPLAFYVFTESKRNAERWLQGVAFGGGCVNNAALHLTNPRLPFGGRGNSGIGRYHGRFSFDTFSHQKSVLKSPTWLDPALKYPPFAGKLNLFKKFLR